MTKEKEKDPKWYAFYTKSDHRSLDDMLIKESFKRDKRIIKLLVYLLYVNMKRSARMIGRIFTINKDTVLNWVEEVKDWPESERAAIISELITGKTLPNKDVMDDKFKIKPYHDE